MNDAAKKQRDTRQRRMVYNAVTSRCDHPSADEIYSDVHAADPGIGKATVYRNLKTLSEYGEIRHVKIPGVDRYDLTLDDHYHIICTQCGKVVDCPIEYNRTNDTVAADETGFVVTRHRTVFEGICPECQKKYNYLERGI